MWLSQEDSKTLLLGLPLRVADLALGLVPLHSHWGKADLHMGSNGLGHTFGVGLEL